MKANSAPVVGNQSNRKELLNYFKKKKYAPLVSALSMLENPISHIFDVGVRGGTPALYKAFPDASFILFDPQEGGKELLRFKPRIYRFLNIALGSQAGMLRINEMGGKTTFKTRTALTATRIQKTYDTIVSTLDAQIQPLDCSLIGIKIDTEGYELEVIQGLDQFAHKVAFIEAEVSLKKRFTDSYRFSELISALDTKGFSVAAFLNHGYGRMPRFLDLLFVNRTLFDDY